MYDGVLLRADRAYAMVVLFLLWLVFHTGVGEVSLFNIETSPTSV